MRDVHQRATSLASRYSPAHLPEIGLNSRRFAEDGEELGFAHWRHIAPLADARGSARMYCRACCSLELAHEEARTPRRAGAGAGSF